MTTIKISDFTQEAASKAKGIHLKSLIEPLLKEKSKFAVDFEGITRFASPFFNNSFASLVLIYGFDAIKEIPVFNISEIGKLTLETSMGNALLLSSNPEYIDEINHIINTNLPKRTD